MRLEVENVSNVFQVMPEPESADLTAVTGPNQLLVQGACHN